MQHFTRFKHSYRICIPEVGWYYKQNIPMDFSIKISGFLRISFPIWTKWLNRFRLSEYFRFQFQFRVFFLRQSNVFSRCLCNVYTYNIYMRCNVFCEAICVAFAFIQMHYTACEVIKFTCLLTIFTLVHHQTQTPVHSVFMNELYATVCVCVNEHVCACTCTCACARSRNNVN